MAKGKDLLGRSGATGLSGSLNPLPKPLGASETEDHKTQGPQHKGPQKNSGSHGGQQGGGGGKTPVGQRPKV